MSMRITLYTRPDCHLCDETRRALASLQSEFPHELREVNIESDEELLRRYAEQIPVVQVGAYTLRAPIDPQDLRVTLGAAQVGAKPAPAAASAKREGAIKANRGLLFFARHWLAIFNLLVFVYVGLPFLAPVLMKIGATQPASWIYTAYSPMCHQWAFRSWFLFGSQPAYPLERAGTSLVPYEIATGMSASDLWGARAFLGNAIVGYKVAFCERDVAIYAGILAAGLAFALVRRQLKPLPVWIWIVLGVVPIAIDGGTQLLSFLPLGNFPVRESTPFLRSLTGGLFGVMNVWLAYPYVEESMAETRALAATRLSGVGRSMSPPASPPGSPSSSA
jgi:uncharacterized membrane protein/glutaredoxin